MTSLYCAARHCYKAACWKSWRGIKGWRGPANPDSTNPNDSHRWRTGQLHKDTNNGATPGSAHTHTSQRIEGVFSSNLFNWLKDSLLIVSKKSDESSKSNRLCTLENKLRLLLKGRYRPGLSVTDNKRLMTRWIQMRRKETMFSAAGEKSASGELQVPSALAP